MRGIQSIVFGIVSLLAISQVHAQLGIWTSQTRQLSTGTVSVPTTFGQQNGASAQFGTLVQTAAATDFGTFNAGTSRQPFFGLNSHRSYFTPDSFVLEYGEALANTGTGMSVTFGEQDAVHIQATFHLDQATPYSISKAFYHSIQTLTPSLHFPTLSGPGGQVIQLNIEKSGSLPAGDWTFLFDFQGVYPGENVLSMGGATHSPASFILSIPEPTSVSFALSACAMLVRRRRSV